MRMKSFFLHLILALAVIIGVFLPCCHGELLTVEESKVAGLVILTIALLATSFIPEYLTALIFFFVAILFNLAPASIIFSGFSSTAFWLIFSGMIVGIGISETGLGYRVAGKLASYLEGSYLKMIAGTSLAGMLLIFIMPSAIGRIVLLVPVTLELSKYFGFHEGSNGKTGLILAATLGTYIPAFSILPSNVPNMILSGLAETQWKISFLYGEYFLLHFPLLGLAKVIAIIFVIHWLYPDTPTVNNSSKTHLPNPVLRKEKKLILVLIIMLILWMTDFIHHISPAWVALGGAIFLMLPGIGIINKSSFSTKINYGSLLFIAGVIGLGGIISYSGLGDVIGKRLIALLPLGPQSPFINYVSISMASTLASLLTTLPGVPALMTPLSPELANITGFSLSSVLMQQVVGFSTVILPYEAPPIIIALSLANEKTNRILKPLSLIAIISIIVLLPLIFFWWKLLGWL